MYLKIIGSMMIVVSTSLIGFYLANKEDFRIKDLLEAKKAFGILKSEIEFARTPLPEAFVYISERVEKPVAEIFGSIADKLSQKSTDSISSIWSETFAQEAKKTYFANEDIELFTSFGKTVGYLDVQMQRNTIEMIVNSIDAKIDTLKELSSKNKKMYQSLGVLGGILICVVLV